MGLFTFNDETVEQIVATFEEHYVEPDNIKRIKRRKVIWADSFSCDSRS